MLRSVLTLLCLWLAADNTACHAGNLTNLFNTGVNTNGTLVPWGAIDPHWKLASGPGPEAALNNAYVVSRDFRPSQWIPENLSSRWIAPGELASGFTGTFRYRTSFDLNGLDPARTVLRMQVLSDNQVTAVLLNHEVTGLSFTNEYARWGVHHLVGGFQPGTNTLEFVVLNPANETGFRCELSVIETPLLLEVQPEGANLMVRWPTNEPCHLLESTTNLSANSWVTNPTTPANVSNRFETTFPQEESARFFRLRRPSAPDPIPNVVWKIWDEPYETYDLSTNCPSNLGCAMTPMSAEYQNSLDASGSIDWARCSTNMPEMEFVWAVFFPPEAGGERYTLPRISGRNSPVLLLPENSLPALQPPTREFTFMLNMTSKVDPSLTRKVYFRIRYVNSQFTLQDYQNEKMHSDVEVEP